METRRIRRQERRRAHRIAGLAVSVAVLCVAIGMSLPHSTTASVLLFVAAGGCLVIVVMRDEARAPLHGLHRVVRLPLFAAVSATLASFWSRLTGSVQAVVGQRMQPTPIVLDEPDDEAEAWWGRTAAAPPPLTPLLSSMPAFEPEAPEALAPEPEPALQPEPVREPQPVLEPEPVLEPVLAAPMPSARVPASGSRLTVGARHLGLAMRSHVESLARKAKRSRDGEFTPSP
jgi:hypothetical protein